LTVKKAMAGALVLLLGLAVFGCTGTKQPEGPAKVDNGAADKGTVDNGTVDNGKADSGKADSGKGDAPQQQPDAGTLVYRHDEFGFSFALPASWKGYTIVTSRWEGALQNAGSGEPAANGPMLSIRHPQWTEQKPRQDIPIMVFTTDQWAALQAGVFHIGAAPINPSELGRTAKYVFALPARYNYAFPEGYEEVERILAGHPLQTTGSP
jgi:hypothetical protein